MDISLIKDAVKKRYGLEIKSIEKIKNVYKIKSDKTYCLKVIKYNFGHFLFIKGAILHLISNGFYETPKIIKTLDDDDYMSLQNSYAYLTLWINARECNYNNPLDVDIAVKKLAKLHNYSINFKVEKNMNPRVGWFKWIETYRTRKDEVLSFKNIILRKNKKTEFDNMYLKVMDDEIERADMSIEDLCNTSYLCEMKREIARKGFCHHDYAHHNILISDDGKVNIIDFDYCILDSYLHDLSSILIRVMKYGKWDISTASRILENYNSVNKISKKSIPIMASFMEFPQEYWQTGIQYYKEKQPWGEEFFVTKLKKIINDRDERQDFADEFKYFKFNG